MISVGQENVFYNKENWLGDSNSVVHRVHSMTCACERLMACSRMAKHDHLMSSRDPVAGKHDQM